MNKRDFRDHLVWVLFVSAWLAGTFYLFKRPFSAPVFAAWCGLVSTMTAAFHWLTIYDDKKPDA